MQTDTLTHALTVYNARRSGKEKTFQFRDPQQTRWHKKSRAVFFLANTKQQNYHFIVYLCQIQNAYKKIRLLSVAFYRLRVSRCPWSSCRSIFTAMAGSAPPPPSLLMSLRLLLLATPVTHSVYDTHRKSASREKNKYSRFGRPFCWLCRYLRLGLAWLIFTDLYAMCANLRHLYVWELNKFCENPVSRRMNAFPWRHGCGRARGVCLKPLIHISFLYDYFILIPSDYSHFCPSKPVCACVCVLKWKNAVDGVLLAVLCMYNSHGGREISFEWSNLSNRRHQQQTNIISILRRSRFHRFRELVGASRQC